MEARSQAPEPAEEPARAGQFEAAAKPSGPIAAVVIAAGIGALVLAILTVWGEANEGFKDSLAYNDRVGPLAGKTIWAAVAFVVSWGALTVGLRNRQVSLTAATVVTLLLLALGYLGTFAPFFELFAE
ncbi:MAG TPA: hypothetical protein VK919_04130 [Solirubrobacterales bacterium]|nr:hypothetical protein [Solirubrobacterales bacterium]